MSTNTPLGEALAGLERVGRHLKRLGADLAKLDAAQAKVRAEEIGRMTIDQLDFECAKDDAERLGLPAPKTAADVRAIVEAARKAGRADRRG